MPVREMTRDAQQGLLRSHEQMQQVAEDRLVDLHETERDELRREATDKKPGKRRGGSNGA